MSRRNRDKDAKVFQRTGDASAASEKSRCPRACCAVTRANYFHARETRYAATANECGGAEHQPIAATTSGSHGSA